MLEKSKPESASSYNRLGVALAALGILAAACSSSEHSESPKPSDVVNGIQYVEFPNVKNGQGKPLECLIYSEGTDPNTQFSHSWFALACDFEGKAQFPPTTPIAQAPGTPPSSPR